MRQAKITHARLIAANLHAVSRVGNRIRAAIPDERGEQKALAHRAGVTPETLSRILSGVIKEPGFETIARIARAAGLDMNRLVAESGDPVQVSAMAREMITLADRRRLQDFADWLGVRFGICCALGQIGAGNIASDARPSDPLPTSEDRPSDPFDLK